MGLKLGWLIEPKNEEVLVSVWIVLRFTFSFLLLFFFSYEQ